MYTGKWPYYNNVYIAKILIWTIGAVTSIKTMITSSFSQHIEQKWSQTIHVEIEPPPIIEIVHKCGGIDEHRASEVSWLLGAHHPVSISYQSVPFHVLWNCHISCQGQIIESETFQLKKPRGKTDGGLCNLDTKLSLVINIVIWWNVHMLRHGGACLWSPHPWVAISFCKLGVRVVTYQRDNVIDEFSWGHWSHVDWSF